MNSKSYRLPQIDLNDVVNENDLAPAVKSILLGHDTFLLRNYANKDALDSLISILNTEDVPDLQTKFDANFTGVLPLEGDILFEQYIFNTDNDLPFKREIPSATMQSLYSRLFKVALYFAKLCLKCVTSDEYTLAEDSYSSVISRYFRNDDPNSQTLPTGEVFEYATSADYKEFLPTGLLTIIPIAKGIKFKPPTVSSDDNTWVSVDEQDCLLLHTGTLLAKLSGGRHTTSALQISPDFNTIQFTLSLPLNTAIDNKGEKLVDCLLRQQIQEFPKAAATLYPRETALSHLKKQISSLKEMFSVSETVLSLYSISRSSITPPELYSLLPQISNMMRKKVSQEDFLKMMFLWPQCYIVEANSKCELTIRLPRNESTSTFTKSRRLQYVEMAEKWYDDMCHQQFIPSDIPMLRINKRRGSSGTFTKSKVDTVRTKSQNSLTKPSYLSNSKEQFMYPEKKHDSQTNLLERLREKERRSAALLSQRQRQYQQFLAVKVTQVFDILHSLPWGKPYTVTYLSTLIVDSLKDTNNPIGYKEAEEILSKLQILVKDEIFVQPVDGGLKVYRWNNLDKEKIASRIHQEETDQ